MRLPGRFVGCSLSAPWPPASPAALPGAVPAAVPAAAAGAVPVRLPASVRGGRPTGRVRPQPRRPCRRDCRPPSPEVRAAASRLPPPATAPAAAPAARLRVAGPDRHCRPRRAAGRPALSLRARRSRSRRSGSSCDPGDPCVPDSGLTVPDVCGTGLTVRRRPGLGRPPRPGGAASFVLAARGPGPALRRRRRGGSARRWDMARWYLQAGIVAARDTARRDVAGRPHRGAGASASAGLGVRRGRARAAPRRRHRARRVAWRAARRSRLHHRRPSRGDPTTDRRRWRRRPGRPAIEFGTVGVQVGGRRARSPPSAPTATTAISRNPEVAFGDVAGRRPAPPRLHHERDGAVGHRRRARSPTPSAAWPTWPAACCARRPRPQESFADDPLRMLRAARFVSTLGVTLGPGRRRGDDRDGRRARPDHRRTGAGRADQAAARPRTRARAWSCWSTPGWPTSCCPSCPALRMAADEHGQHKDVYAHTLQVLEQAIDLEDAGARPRSLRWAALLHDVGKPATREFRPGRTGHLPPPRGGRRAHGAQAAQGAALPQASSSRTSPSWSSCTCASTATATASGPTRRCAATSSTPARCCRGCTSSCARTARPATAQGGRARRGLRHARAAHRGAAGAGGAGRDPARPRRQRDHADPRACGRARWSGQAYKHLLALRMEHGPLGHDRAVAELRRW